MRCFCEEEEIEEVERKYFKSKTLVVMRELTSMREIAKVSESERERVCVFSFFDIYSYNTFIIFGLKVKHGKCEMQAQPFLHVTESILGQ